MVFDVGKQFPNAELGEAGGASDNLALKLRCHYGNNAVSPVCFIICGNLFYGFIDMLIGQMAHPNVYKVRKPHPEQDKAVLVFYVV
jgi:hypothetical protein